MGLLIGYDLAGIDPKIASAIDSIVAPIQVWAGKVDGVNADERLNQLSSGVANLSTVPTGALLMWATATAPTGYLLCDGSAVSRTTYATLFGVLGTTAGAGDGTNTFNVPDMRQRFPLGKAASGTGSTLLGTGGTIDHLHTGPSHTHPVSGSTGSESSHTHTMGTTGANDTDATCMTATHTHSESGGGTTGNATGTAAVVALNGHVHEPPDTGPGSSHNHGVGTLATTAGGTGNTGTANPPFFVVNYIVKT